MIGFLFGSTLESIFNYDSGSPKAAELFEPENEGPAPLFKGELCGAQYFHAGHEAVQTAPLGVALFELAQRGTKCDRRPHFEKHALFRFRQVRIQPCHQTRVHKRSIYVSYLSERIFSIGLGLENLNY
jgi:hypothetical protein